MRACARNESVRYAMKASFNTLISQFRLKNTPVLNGLTIVIFLNSNRAMRAIYSSRSTWA
jgi:hypothetical protein